MYLYEAMGQTCRYCNRYISTSPGYKKNAHQLMALYLKILDIVWETWCSCMLLLRYFFIVIDVDNVNFLGLAFDQLFLKNSSFNQNLKLIKISIIMCAEVYAIWKSKANCMQIYTKWRLHKYQWFCRNVWRVTRGVILSSVCGGIELVTSNAIFTISSTCGSYRPEILWYCK